MAKEFMHTGLASECCAHNGGYAVFVGIFYKLFGYSNPGIIKIIQIVIETITALLLFLSSRKLFNFQVALIVLILYVLNPLTSSFVPYLLPEIFTLFLVTIIMVLLINKNYEKKKLLWFTSGILYGILFIDRMQYFYMVIILILLTALIIKGFRKKMLFLVIALSGFIIICSYQMYSYYGKYKIITLYPPNSQGPILLYKNLVNNVKYPELFSLQGLEWFDDPNFLAVDEEYFQAVASNTVPQMRNKYKKLLLVKIKSEWTTYIKNTTRNMFWVWDKYHLFTFFDPLYPGDKWILRIYNILLILLFIIGLIIYIMHNRKWYKKPLVIFTIIFFIYMSTVIPQVSTESRHSLSFYPLIFFWGGYGLVYIYNRLKRIGYRQ